LVVYYSIDGGAFTEWGGAGNGEITSDGVTELTDPLGTGNSTIEYNYLILRVDFVTDIAGQSPILEGITIRFLMRPAVLYGHSFNIVGASHAEYGHFTDDRTVKDIIDDLETARASTAPITLVDPFEVSHQGYISSVERRAVERHSLEEEGGSQDIEHIIRVNFVEVG
jgi:hypothetical protein